MDENDDYKVSKKDQGLKYREGICMSVKKNCNIFMYCVNDF